MSCEQEAGCWCGELPNILPVPENKTEGCLCRSCLTSKLALQLISTAAPRLER
jgi:hypothetical protein